ncbi:hypothetical protein MmiAt1_17450 [Methanimicrococcus sp. At1]|uniref:Uncharacterized protein n=1 Tax=Methanimicrococcus hacksteinii TaxID=3028293 RepID=A0ABU3VRT3_9EURY|nr:hypothetical protein [Methanimicrococcus sp. At1]MDV0446129.1 hypothetical protein [Methanimicrococcus sp. At1]
MLVLIDYSPEKYSSLKQVEMPDLQTNEKNIGIEVTISPQLNEFFRNDVYNTRIKGKNKNDIKPEDLKYLKKLGMDVYFKNEKAIGNSYGINHSLSFLLNTLNTKLKRINSGDYSIFKENNLYIFSTNNHMEHEIDLYSEKAIELQKSYDITFDEIYINQDDDLYILLKNETQHINLQHLSLIRYKREALKYSQSLQLR